MYGVKNIVGGEQQVYEKLKNTISFNVHCCLICIVQKFDKQRMTVDVQPVIRERYINDKGEYSFINFPLLINVPVVFPCSGESLITFPIKQGDECIVIFSDLAIDNWFINSGIQNPVEIRRHDLSDGIAIFGIRSLPKIVSGYEEDKIVLKLGNSSLKVSNSSIEVSSNSFTWNGKTILTEA